MEQKDFTLQGMVKPIIIALAIIFMALIANPFTVIAPSERGIKIMFGSVKEEILMPGLRTHIPVIEQIKKYQIEPQESKMTIPVGSTGAITKDNQIVGTTITFFWRYNPSRILEIPKNYSGGKLLTILQATGEEAVKNSIGKYTIFDLAEKQKEISAEIKKIVIESIGQYPLEIVDVKLTNFDWSPAFDDQVDETMKKAQEVKKKEQELQIATIEANKTVAAAEAQKQSTIAIAEGEKEKVRLEAEAKVLEADGIKQYNEKISPTFAMQVKLKELEIELTKVKTWNGQYVPNNVYTPIPVDLKGGLKGQ